MTLFTDKTKADPPELIMTVGLPYSGKSNFAKQSGFPIVCPDAIRLAIYGHRYNEKLESLVWVFAKLMVRSLFWSGHDRVVLDATNTTAKRRDEWKDSDWHRKYVICDIHKEACVTRATQAKDEDIIPVIDRMAAQLEYDGIMYGRYPLGENVAKMADHVKFPDGLKDMQLYHEGHAEDDS